MSDIIAVEDLRKKSKKDLFGMLMDSKKELMHLRFQAAAGSLLNHRRIRYAKKLVAKIKTLLNNDLFEKADEGNNA